MSQATSTDYSKIYPLISGIKKIANEFEGEDRKVVLELLIRDALGKTASDIVKQSQQLPAPETPQKAVESKIHSSPAQTNPTRETAHQTHASVLRLDASKIDPFLKRHSVLPTAIEKLFLQNGEKIERLYASLNATKKAEGQVKVALLKCLSNGIQSGQLSASIQDIIEECKEFGIYDANLSKNLGRRKQLFASLDDKEVRLNAEGEKELASLVKELAQQES